MITEGEAAILLETTRRALGNQSQSKQRSTLQINFRRQIWNEIYHIYHISTTSIVQI